MKKLWKTHKLFENKEKKLLQLCILTKAKANKIYVCKILRVSHGLNFVKDFNLHFSESRNLQK